jgi:regulator of nucleoside diphosphate kinase
VETRTIYITQQDMVRLQKLLDEAVRPARKLPEHLQALAGEMSRAVVVAAKAVPADVVTMNSRVVLTDLETGEDETYTLVFPDAADISEHRISVLAPVGTGMLGYRVGSVFEWPVPGGMRRLKVSGVLYQPEAAGDFDR